MERSPAPEAMLLVFPGLLRQSPAVAASATPRCPMQQEERGKWPWENTVATLAGGRVVPSWCPDAATGSQPSRALVSAPAGWRLPGPGAEGGPEDSRRDPG